MMFQFVYIVKYLLCKVANNHLIISTRKTKKFIYTLPLLYMTGAIEVI